MANPTTKVNFAVPLADFLATAISDGTIADIIQVEKVDATGKEAKASEIKEFYGELLGNLRDDFFIAAYTQLQGAQNAALSTSGAVTDSLTVATLSTDGDAYYVEATVLGKTTAAGELVVVELGGVFYRSGGTVSLIAPIHTVTDVGLAGADAELVISGDDVSIDTTGIAAKNIGWDVVVRKVQEFSGP